MTAARAGALGAFLFVLPHLALADGDALPVGRDSLVGVYEYGNVGGMVPWTSRAFLFGGAKYTYQRTDYRHPPMTTVSCSPDIPLCTDDPCVTPSMIGKAFAHGDVQNAFEWTIPIFYGCDTRPVDGTAFEVKRIADGRSFLIGSPCFGIPPGLAALRELLLKLDKQQLAHPLCQAAIKN
jgi:hypothetical protein